MDIERKAEIAGRVLLGISAPVIVVLDLLVAWGMLWVPFTGFVIPVLLVTHAIVLIRIRMDVWQFIGWGLGPPALILVGLGVLGMLEAFPRVGA
jgi:hypothetical protein